MENITENVKKERAFFETLGDIYPPDPTVQVANIQIAGIQCYWFTPQQYDEKNIIIYLHGGMYGLGSVHSHQPMVSFIASALTARILFVEYSLAPEQPYPNGLNDVWKVYEDTVANYPNKILSVFGDSAGGGLVISLIHRIIEKKMPEPSSVVMISPWIYLKCNTGSYERRKEVDPILTREKLLEYAEYYSETFPEKAGKADPGELSFESFPPLFILVGSNEILFEDSVLFYEMIKKVQPNTQFKEYVDQVHVWPIGDINSKASQEALTDIHIFFTSGKA